MTIKGWCESALYAVAELTMGQSPDSKFYTENESNLPFLQGCAEFGVRHPTPKINCSAPKKVAKNGSLLFSVRAPVGRLNVADRDYIIGRGLAGIIATEIVQDYLEQYLISQGDEFGNASQGSTFKAINSAELSQWPIVHPECKDEQAKIAEILSTVDRAIEQTQSLIAKQQRIKTGLMQDLLTHGIDSSGNLRSEQTHKFKDSPLGRIPEEWDVEPWGKHVEHWGYGPRFSAENYDQNGNVRTIRGTDFTKEGEILYDQVPRAKLSAEMVRRHALQHNDVVVVTTADCRLTSVFKEQPEHYMASAYAVTYRFCESAVAPYFVKFFMQTEMAKNQVKGYVRQGTLGNLPGSDMLKVFMAIPKKEEQKLIVQRLQTQQHTLEQNQFCLSKLQSLKTGLMQDLLTGKKRVIKLLKKESVAV